jgi:hypothetical protein
MKDPTTALHRIIFHRKKYRDDKNRSPDLANQTLAGVFLFKDDRARARTRARDTYAVLFRRSTIAIW